MPAGVGSGLGTGLGILAAGTRADGTACRVTGSGGSVADPPHHSAELTDHLVERSVRVEAGDERPTIVTVGDRRWDERPLHESESMARPLVDIVGPTAFEPAAQDVVVRRDNRGGGYDTAQAAVGQAAVGQAAVRMATIGRAVWGLADEAVLEVTRHHTLVTVGTRDFAIP